MNRHLAKGLPVIALLGVVACTDLAENPYDVITEANFKPTTADLAALMGPVYTPQRGLWTGWYGMVDWQGEVSDELLTPVRPNGWDDGGIYYANHQHRWTPSSPGMGNGRWGNAYSGINAANRVIYQIESGVLPLDEAAQHTTISELRAARAYYYSILLDLFGNVPIQTDFTSLEVPQQSTRQEVYDFVVGELNEVMPDLSDKTAEMYGRMNKWAAKAILARVYLNAQVYTGTQQWQKVIDNTQEIIASGLFALEPNYRTIFSRTNHTSKEMVFATPYDATFGGGSNFHNKTMKPGLRQVFGLSTTPWGGSAGNPQFIDTYDPDDTRMNGVPSDNGKGGTWLTGSQWDPTHQFGYDFAKFVPGMRDQTCPGRRLRYEDGYPVWKYEIYAGQTGASDVDFPVVRYADVLLMQAEAKLRSGDPNGAAALVTQVRQRAFARTNPAKATVTGAELMQGSSYNYGWYDCDGVVKTGPGGTPVTDGGADIQYGRMLDELGWELAVEALRRQQLIRFGVYTTKTWFNHTPNGDYRKLFPIPENRMESNPNLVQNPGY